MMIGLYNNISPANYVYKEIQYVDYLNGFLRAPTSIVDPVITIQRSTPTGFNYIYIPEFKRYYFVENISSESTQVVAISAHVDVLMTYQAQIAEMEAIVRRQEFNYNLYLSDGTFKVFQNPRYKLLKFPNAMSDFSYILALAGNGD